jgi:hypothetical protein
MGDDWIEDGMRDNPGYLALTGRQGLQEIS